MATLHAIALLRFRRLQARNNCALAGPRVPRVEVLQESKSSGGIGCILLAPFSDEALPARRIIKHGPEGRIFLPVFFPILIDDHHVWSAWRSGRKDKGGWND